MHAGLELVIAYVRVVAAYATNTVTGMMIQIGLS